MHSCVQWRGSRWVWFVQHGSKCRGLHIFRKFMNTVACVPLEICWEVERSPSASMEAASDPVLPFRLHQAEHPAHTVNVLKIKFCVGPRTFRSWQNRLCLYIRQNYIDTCNISFVSIIFDKWIIWIHHTITSINARNKAWPSINTDRTVLQTPQAVLLANCYLPNWQRPCATSTIKKVPLQPVHPTPPAWASCIQSILPCIHSSRDSQDTS